MHITAVLDKAHNLTLSKLVQVYSEITTWSQQLFSGRRLHLLSWDDCLETPLMQHWARHSGWPCFELVGGPPDLFRSVITWITDLKKVHAPPIWFRSKATTSFLNKTANEVGFHSWQNIIRKKGRITEITQLPSWQHQYYLGRNLKNQFMLQYFSVLHGLCAVFLTVSIILKQQPRSVEKGPSEMKPLCFLQLTLCFFTNYPGHCYLTKANACFIHAAGFS